MIVTELYDGQGLGNQLWSYVVTRILAEERGFSFGIMSKEKFKGHSFMDLDFGEKVTGGAGPEGGPPLSLPQGIEHYYVEKDTWYKKFHCDIRDFDPGLLLINDNTKIEGYFQSEKFILHKKDQIKKWLKVKDEYDSYEFSHDNICILNIRGGEYKGTADLILPKKYWQDAIRNMLLVNPDFEFIIITDDVNYAKKLLPDYPVYHFDIGRDYSIVKNAKYLILSNSSFAFFAAWTSETVKYVIAPKYWARHNVSDGFWACAFNLYRDWLWQDVNGKLFTYEECENEYISYSKDKKINELPGYQQSPPDSFFEKLNLFIKRIISYCKRKILNY